jgi:hypothetical protein
LPAATLDAPVSLSERLKSRSSIDESAGLRWEALTFYSDIFKDHPLGLGTGFTNKFATGPHIEWLKLAVDEGILAPLLLMLMLGGAAWRAIMTRSPALLSITPMALLGSLLSHTVLVDPLIPAALTIALGTAQARALRSLH